MMKRPCVSLSLSALAIVGLAALSGCGQSLAPGGQASREGAKYLLEREPADAQGIVDLRTALEESGKSGQVVLLGRVGGLGQPTWDPQRAAFMVADLSLVKDEAEHDETPKHDADACPFCRAKKKKELAGLAMIQIVDANGNIPAIDARELLGLDEGQTIVVRGEGHIDDLGTLVVRAGSIYVKPEGKD